MKSTTPLIISVYFITLLAFFACSNNPSIEELKEANKTCKEENAEFLKESLILQQDYEILSSRMTSANTFFDSALLELGIKEQEIDNKQHLAKIRLFDSLLLEKSNGVKQMKEASQISSKILDDKYDEYENQIREFQEILRSVRDELQQSQLENSILKKVIDSTRLKLSFKKKTLSKIENEKRALLTELENTKKKNEELLTEKETQKTFHTAMMAQEQYENAEFLYSMAKTVSGKKRKRLARKAFDFSQKAAISGHNGAKNLAERIKKKYPKAFN